MSSEEKAYCYGLATVLLWSTVAAACKVSLRYLTPMELVFFSTLTSTGVLLIMLMLQGNIQQLRAMHRTDWLQSLKLGILNPLLYYPVLFKAYEMLPAQQAQALNYTWAITLSLLAVPLLGQSLNKKQLIAICLSYFGVLVISTKGDLLSFSFASPVGVFLALLSTVLWALYWLLNARDKREPLVALCMNFLCALPCITLYMVVMHPWHAVDLRGVAGAVYLGFFEMSIPFLLWLKAMRLTSNTARVANLIFLSPFLSLVFIYFLVGEKILPSTIIGLIFILSGLVLQGRAK